jgi:RNA polymerase sigma factor (sigma-70 family)
MTKKIDWSIAYQKSGPKLLGVCRRYIKDIKIAEDILQEAFIVAIQKQDSFKGSGSLEGWLKRIVVNMSLNYIKTEQKNKYLTNGIMDIEDIEDTFDGSNESKSNMYAVDFSREELLDVIDSLPSHHKTVFNLYVIDDFSHVKIGEMLNISVGTSKSHLHRARMKIQSFLFEKAKEKEIDKSKKIIIALLLFLGFEEKIMADTFKSKFSNFEIQPKKLNSDFGSSFINISMKDNASNLFLNPSNYKFLFGIIAAALIILSFNKAYTNDLFSLENDNANSVKENAKNKNTIEAIQYKIKKMDSLKMDSDKNLRNVSNTKEIKIPISKNQSVINNLNNQKTVKQEATVTLDTANNKQPKQVFIKKQVIKKDTIYVFK